MRLSIKHLGPISLSLLYGTILSTGVIHAATPQTHKIKTAPARPQTRHSVVSRKDESISVTGSRQALNGGGGMMRIETAPRAVQTVTKQFISIRSPTSTALDLIANLPSVNTTTPDPSGMQGGQLQSRGFTDLDTGLLLDGAPASASKYLQQNIDSENIEEVSLTPGSSPTAAPVTAAAGGTMTEHSVNPSHHAGGFADASYGTNNLSREFLRLETGEIGNSGIRSFISFSNSHSRSWMGAGVNDRRHLDFAVRRDWKNGSYAKVFFSWNNENFVIDNYPTAQQFYLYKDTGQGYGRSAESQNLNYWKNSIDHWNQVYLTAPVHAILPARLTFDIQPYFTYGTGYDASPRTTVLNSETNTYRNIIGYFNQNDTKTVGVISKLSWQADQHNTLTAGYWYENAYTLQSYPTSYALPQGGAPNPNDSRFHIFNPDLQDAGQETHAIFVEDTAKYLNNKLTIHAGFKFTMANLWNRDYYGAKGSNRTEPLPQLQIGYQLDDHNQIYLNAEADYRQPNQVDMGWLYTSVPLPRNEHTIKEELGWRYHNNYIITDIAFFNYNVNNRIVDQYVGMNNYSPFSIGSQHMRGVDIMVSGRSINGFSPYASFEYLHAKQDSNVFDPYLQAMLPSKGTQGIMAPRFMANVGLTYEKAGFFGNASLHYTGAQSVSISGDERMPGYFTNTLSLGYHFHPVGFMKSPTFKLNFTNLTGSILRTGAMGAVYSKNDPSIVHSGSLPTYTGYGNSFMVIPRFTMIGTLSTAF